MARQLPVLEYKLHRVPSTDELAKELRCAIINELWPPVNADSIITVESLEIQLGLQSFFKHYIRQTSSIISINRKLEAVTHEKLLEIAGLICDKANTHAQIRAALLSPTSPNAIALESDQAEALIELTARIFLLFYVGKTARASRMRSIRWADEDNFKDVVEAAIPRNEIEGAEGRKRIPVRLTARNLDRIGGIQISWTWCLHEHLEMDENDCKIKIFHMASILRRIEGSTRDTIPIGLVRETLDTLSLLLPKDDQETQDWYFREQMRLHAIPEKSLSKRISRRIDYLKLGLRGWGLRRLIRKPRLNGGALTLDPNASKEGRLPDFKRRISHYKYWGGRLEYLVQVYYDHEPRNLKQWARDDRKPTQRANFWITVGAFLLATISLALTAVQTWASVFQLEYAKLALSVSGSSDSSPAPPFATAANSLAKKYVS